jgi:hypothetical protein
MTLMDEVLLRILPGGAVTDGINEIRITPG